MALSLYFLKGNLLEDISVKVFASQRLCAFCDPDKLSPCLTDWLWNYGWLLKAMAAVDFDSSSSDPTGSLIKSVPQCEMVWRYACEIFIQNYSILIQWHSQNWKSVELCAVSICRYEGRRKLAVMVLLQVLVLFVYRVRFFAGDREWEFAVRKLEEIKSFTSSAKEMEKKNSPEKSRPWWLC